MILIYLFSLMGLAYAETTTLVTSFTEVQSISEKYQKNKLYQVRRFGRLVEMDKNDLGRATSPYFKEDNKVKKLFHNYLDNCFEMTVDDEYSYAHSVSCNYVPDFKIEGREHFKLISQRDVVSETEKLFVLRTFTQDYEIPGVTAHHRNTLNTNGEVEIDPRQKTTLKFKLLATTKARLIKRD